ncbi:UDP-glucose:glycoprotein glucosyltransferase 1-like [Oppia nitens]|uniref:UDP-glucose:glycoprotein glucosyltransferase 1-like n=1 Tax=Oppia nitens TaxID=1686743 RepID=UPI0023DA2790|nr:UDP-glucose:glycoprotein glucosyltransferase 1-like [Oppia nitens]
MSLSINSKPTIHLLPICFILIKCLLQFSTCDVSPTPTTTSTAKPSHKSISIGLSTNWLETPLYLEFAELLAQENNELFWRYIDAIHETLDTASIDSLSAKAQYDLILQLSDRLLAASSPTLQSVVKFSLSLRIFSPSVVMFNQISNQVVLQRHSLKRCDVFIELSRPADDTSLTVDAFSPFICNLNDLRKSLDVLNKDISQELIHPNVYKSDHIYTYRSSSEPRVTAILYGQIGTKAFQELHKNLLQLANKGSIKYVVRHYLRSQSDRKVSLSGYGVELAIKSTEYKAQDDTRVKGEVTSDAKNLKQEESQEQDEAEGFVFSTLKEKFPDKKDKLDEFHTHLLDKTKEIATLKVWELQEISLQATKKLLTTDKTNALNLLRDISQNFPTEARSLIKIKVDSDLRKEIERNQQMFSQTLNLGTNDAALFINGMYYDVDTMDVFALLDVIRKELKLTEGLSRLIGGDDSEKLKRLINLNINEDKQDFQIDIRDGAVMYVNDIENDKLYRNWPSSLQDMLRPTYPGMLRNIRKNMFHLVLVVDPSKREAHDIIKLAESFYVHKAPVRIGIVFAVNPDESVTGRDDAGLACLEAFNFINQDKGHPYEGLSFLTDVIATIGADKDSQRDLTSGDVINQFKSKYKNEDIDMIFGSDSDYDTGRKLAWDFIRRTGIGNPLKALLNGVVLKDSHLNAELFEEVVLTEIMKQTNAIQKAIYKSELSESDDVLEWLMTQKTVMPRLNRLILNIDSSNPVPHKYIDFMGKSLKFADIDSFDDLNLKDLEHSLANSLNYITTKSDKCDSVSVWLATDLQTKRSRDMLNAVVSHLRENSLSMRLAIIHNTYGPIGRVIETAIASISRSNHLLQFLNKFLSSIQSSSDDELSDELKVLEKSKQFIADEYIKEYEKNYKKLTSDSQIFKAHQAFRVRSLGIGNKDTAIVINGKVIAIPESDTFVEDDFSLIEKYVTNSFADKIYRELGIKDDQQRCSDLVMKISAILLSNPQSKARHDVKYHSDKHSVLQLDPIRPDEPSLQFVAIMDPLTRGAQKLTPILITLTKIFNINTKIFFNCVDRHSEMPLKSFYRFVIESEPKFSDDNQLIDNKAYFASVPTTPLLTLGMAVPDNWLVESTDSVYDLDNIHLEQVDGTGISAQFELEYLLLEGHCFEQSTGNPPRGLQFILGTNSTPIVGDTIVMANLGYFQLKANPGLWNLNLRQGRSDDIYSIVSHEGTDSPSNSPQVLALISSFKSNVIKIRVNKKPGKQNEELLYDSDDDELDDMNSLWNSFSWNSSPSSSKKKDKTNATVNEEPDRINVFSLATGHLYERLMRIMILSVLKNTKTPVKFWFLKNYLSPNFKNILPFMAKKYNFEYSLVQYKWPRWLHQQTEKQRIIWGYKILFLDVLFPLDVKKIIFVDADQVVRADLKELRDLDLEGAPYGYTPFCESRKDMDGFRFWKSGYWATHLHGRRYHISALYVVDLQKFRRLAAGDRLRGQYQGLSQDPNSLSNLDQDLPNNMIHQVSIKSLPQEWLWCETWCDDGSKATAKTIDLCNNPKTKEPKLTAARRIIHEWEPYDTEIKDMIEEFRQLTANGTNIQEFLAAEDKSQTVIADDVKHIEL